MQTREQVLETISDDMQLRTGDSQLQNGLWEFNCGWLNNLVLEFSDNFVIKYCHRIGIDASTTSPELKCFKKPVIEGSTGGAAHYIYFHSDIRSGDSHEFISDEAERSYIILTSDTVRAHFLSSYCSSS